MSDQRQTTPKKLTWSQRWALWRMERNFEKALFARHKAAMRLNRYVTQLGHPEFCAIHVDTPSTRCERVLVNQLRSGSISQINSVDTRATITPTAISLRRFFFPSPIPVSVGERYHKLLSAVRLGCHGREFTLHDKVWGVTAALANEAIRCAEQGNELAYAHVTGGLVALNALVSNGHDHAMRELISPSYPARYQEAAWAALTTQEEELPSMGRLSALLAQTAVKDSNHLHRRPA